MMAWTGRLFWMLQLTLVGYGFYVAMRPGLNADVNMSAAARNLGMEPF
jgi:hypothetical protein